MLQVHALEAFYGDSQVLFGMDLDVREGEVVTLLGRNGMGKTTTVRAILGLTPPASGHVRLDGTEIAGWRPHRIARAGIGLVPEGRQIFPNLTARENLVATARPPRGQRIDGWSLGKVLQLFPGLAERQDNYGSQLSGGEQQMLAIARALMTNPRLLVLDEATEGLAPLVRREIWQVLARLKDSGQSILLIDKNLEALLQLADRHTVIERGKVVWRGLSDELRRSAWVRERYLGV